jgi:hypothetical protein
MVYGRFGGHLFVWVIGQVLTNRIGELQLTGLCKLEDRGSREHLIHGADSKTRIQAIGYMMFAVG